MLALLLALILATSTSLSPSLVLNQSNPLVGQAISLTAIYPKISQARAQQYGPQPSVQIQCYQSGALVWVAYDNTRNKQSLGQGWTQSIYPFTLGGTADGYYWVSGAASCSGLLYYFDVNGQAHILVSMAFEVGA